MFKAQLEYNRTLRMVLMQNVQNTPEVRKMLTNGTLQCCTVKPSLILHAFQVVVAANKAVLNFVHERMTTRTIYTEILFNLSLSGNISQSLLSFGIDDADKNFIVCVVDKDLDNSLEDVLSHIHGKQCSMDDLSSFSDEDTIKKHYNIKDSEKEVSPLLESVTSRIALGVL
ncbi:EKC/KEOPS complex subunit TPRKB-like [Anabrus simplex]|uniref:EKC/KEOPS complex subunit TPRKB-like n=1 Tax=Anabrus simplex TaxID=316456 RepID=UPI0034DD679A